MSTTIGSPMMEAVKRRFGGLTIKEENLSPQQPQHEQQQQTTVKGEDIKEEMEMCDMPPVIALSTAGVNRNRSFALSLKVGTRWRTSHGITEQHIATLSSTFSLFLEPTSSTTSITLVDGCTSCKRSQVITLNTSRQEAGLAQLRVSEDGADVEEYLWDYCRSSCNSSRLHLGGRVMIGFYIPGLMCPLLSPPLELLSKLRLKKYPPISSHSRKDSGGSTDSQSPPAKMLMEDSLSSSAPSITSTTTVTTKEEPQQLEEDKITTMLGRDPDQFADDFVTPLIKYSLSEPDLHHSVFRQQHQLSRQPLYTTVRVYQIPQATPAIVEAYFTCVYKSLMVSSLGLLTFYHLEHIQPDIYISITSWRDKDMAMAHQGRSLTCGALAYPATVIQLLACASSFPID